MQTLALWEAFFDSFKANLAPMAHATGTTSAYTDEDPRVHPEQTAWARQMTQGIYVPVKDRVYVAVGYQLCSTTMVVGTDGVVITAPGRTTPRPPPSCASSAGSPTCRCAP
jgi:hypothetical protein